jgi:4,5:9,10-diseco-3-hydroxy-5,9,17-trioxoandrosta-1(10),2-diene-4-oate hydrolase
MRMHSVAAAGSRVHYREAGAGRPLLLVHGLGQSSTTWLRTMESFARTRRVIVPDLPGFGTSAAPDSARLDPQYYADAIDEIVETLDLGPLDVVGHSAGGLEVLLAALASPARFERIVLVDPAGFTPTPDNVVGTAAVSLFRLLVSLPRTRAMVRALYSTAFYDVNALDEATVDELFKRRSHPDASRVSKQAFTELFEFCKDLAPFHARLASLGAPVLAIWGVEDRLFRVADADVAGRVLRHVRIERFERCGHCPQIERPERLVEATMEFLNGA